MPTGVYARRANGQAERVPMLGRRFGRLVVIGEAGPRHWLVRCDCGEEATAQGDNLRSGHTRSCGCLMRQRAGEISALTPGQAAKNSRRCAYKHKAARRGLSWSLSDEVFDRLITESCFWCGSPPSNILGGYRHSGIDRLDSTIGYTEENCVACCKVCNRAKSSDSVAEFEAWIDRIAVRRAKRLASELP